MLNGARHRLIVLWWGFCWRTRASSVPSLPFPSRQTPCPAIVDISVTQILLLCGRFLVMRATQPSTDCPLLWECQQRPNHGPPSSFTLAYCNISAFIIGAQINCDFLLSNACTKLSVKPPNPDCAYWSKLLAWSKNVNGFIAVITMEICFPTLINKKTRDWKLETIIVFV